MNQWFLIVDICCVGTLAIVFIVEVFVAGKAWKWEKHPGTPVPLLTYQGTRHGHDTHTYMQTKTYLHKRNKSLKCNKPTFWESQGFAQLVEFLSSMCKRCIQFLASYTPGMGLHVCNPSTVWETGGSYSEFQDSLRYMRLSLEKRVCSWEVEG